MRRGYAFYFKDHWLKRHQVNFGILSDLGKLTLTAMAFKAMLAETRPGELSPACSESSRALAIPIFANLRA